MQFQMKKEEKSHLDQPKPRSIYKYELKATNQIFKDTLDLCHSSLLNTAATHRTHYPPFQHHDETQNPPRKPKTTKQNSLSHFLLSTTKRPNSPQERNASIQPQKTIFQEYQSGRKDFSNQFKIKHKKERIREWDYLDKDAFINSELYSFSENSSSQPEQNAEDVLSKQRKTSNNIKKDLKRQRRGLADISLKVKNIVARLGKMTFKEVSDEVLKESEEDLPHEPQQKEKETKNIRRRVYDALNVLVAVGILAKVQRCVVHTQITNISGKKLSKHYDIVAERKRSLKEQQEIYQKRLANLILLKKNFDILELFHKRNRNQPISKKQEQTRDYSVQIVSKGNIDKLYFPLIFLLPPKIMTQKIRIQIQYQGPSSEYIKKYIIEGTDYILTDLDTLNYLNLESPEAPKNLELKPSEPPEKQPLQKTVIEIKSAEKLHFRVPKDPPAKIAEEEIFQSD